MVQYKCTVWLGECDYRELNISLTIGFCWLSAVAQKGQRGVHSLAMCGIWTEFQYLIQWRDIIRTTQDSEKVKLLTSHSLLPLKRGRGNLSAKDKALVERF